jgi:hypothetical protein
MLDNILKNAMIILWEHIFISISNGPETIYATCYALMTKYYMKDTINNEVKNRESILKKVIATKKWFNDFQTDNCGLYQEG